MQLCCHTVEELNKHAYLYETYEQLSYHAAADSASQSFEQMYSTTYAAISPCSCRIKQT